MNKTPREAEMAFCYQTDVGCWSADIANIGLMLAIGRQISSFCNCWAYSDLLDQVSVPLPTAIEVLMEHNGDRLTVFNYLTILGIKIVFSYS